MTNSRNFITAAGALVLTATTLTALSASPASAGDDGEVRRAGSCSGSTGWKVKAKPDDGRIEVEAEIDSNRAGQTWRWVLRHDGEVAARGQSQTTARSGSFEVERRTSNSAGRDSFRFRATHGGEVCVARVTL